MRNTRKAGVDKRKPRRFPVEASCQWRLRLVSLLSGEGQTGNMPASRQSSSCQKVYSSYYPLTASRRYEGIIDLPPAPVKGNSRISATISSQDRPNRRQACRSGHNCPLEGPSGGLREKMPLRGKKAPGRWEAARGRSGPGRGGGNLARSLKLCRRKF